MQPAYYPSISRRRLAPWAVLAFLFTTTAVQASTNPKDFLLNDPGATNRLIIRMRPHTHLATPEPQYLTRLSAVPLTYYRRLPNGAKVYRLSAHAPLSYVRSLAQKIARDPNVLYAEADTRLSLNPGVIQAQPIVPGTTLHPNSVQQPDDPLFSNQWNLTNPVVGINAPGAWKMTTGASSITVAVLDSGALMAHEDLRGRVVAGYDFTDNDMDPTDNGEGKIQWHGTGTASVIGAASNNGIGMAGVNWGSNLLVVRIGTGAGAYSSDMADGIYWAAGLPVTGVPLNKTPARVLNVSFNGLGPCPASVQQAITAARAKGTILVVAAGNFSQDIATTQPGNCKGVITVAATDAGGNRAPYSNYGTGITVAAPGTSLITAGSVASTWDPSSFNYLIRSGTSFAAPQVTGIVSLMLSVNPTLTPDDVEAILRSSVHAFPAHANCSGICTTGIVDAGAAVWLAAPDALKVPKPVLPAPPVAKPPVGTPPVTPAPTGNASTPPITPPGSPTGQGSTTDTSPTPTASPANPPTSQAPGTAAPANPPDMPATGSNPPTTSGAPANPPAPGAASPTTGTATPPLASTPPASPAPGAIKPAYARYVRSIAGANQNVAPGSKVLLHGAGETDSTARVVSYKWIQLTGPAVQLSNSRTAQPSFSAPARYTTMTFRLIVIDSRGHAASADTKVVTTPSALSISSRPATPAKTGLFGWW